MEFMDFPGIHGFSWNSWIFMISLQFLTFAWDFENSHATHGCSWQSWMFMSSWNAVEFRKKSTCIPWFLILAVSWDIDLDHDSYQNSFRLKNEKKVNFL